MARGSLKYEISPLRPFCTPIVYIYVCPLPPLREISHSTYKYQTLTKLFTTHKTRHSHPTMGQYLDPYYTPSTSSARGSSYPGYTTASKSSFSSDHYYPSSQPSSSGRDNYYESSASTSSGGGYLTPPSSSYLHRSSERGDYGGSSKSSYGGYSSGSSSRSYSPSSDHSNYSSTGSGGYGSSFDFNGIGSWVSPSSPQLGIYADSLLQCDSDSSSPYKSSYSSSSASGSGGSSKYQSDYSYSKSTSSGSSKSYSQDRYERSTEDPWSTSNLRSSRGTSSYK